MCEHYFNNENLVKIICIKENISKLTQEEIKNMNNTITTKAI